MCGAYDGLFLRNCFRKLFYTYVVGGGRSEMQFVDHEYINLLCNTLIFLPSFLWNSYLKVPNSVSCWIKYPDGGEIETENTSGITV